METKIYTLKNNRKLIFYPRKETNGILIDLQFKAGAINDFPNKQGLAHFCEHAIFSFSTKDKTYEEKTKLFQKLRVNGFTNAYNMTFRICTTEKTFKQSIDLIIDSINNLQYNENEFIKEKNVIENEIALRNNDNDRLLALIQRSFLKHAKISNLKNYSYAGTNESLSNITIKDIEKFIKTYLTINNLTVIACGNINKKTLKYFISKLNSLPISTKKGIESKNLTKLCPPKAVLQPSNEKDCSIIQLWYKIDRYSNIKEPKQDILYSLTNKVLSNILFKYFRKDKSLCYSIQNISDLIGDNTFSLIHIPCANSNLNKIIQEYPKFLSQLNIEEIKENFAQIKEKMLYYYNFDIQSLYEIKNEIKNVYFMYNRLYNKRFIKEREQTIKDVTFEDFYIFFKKALNSKPYVIILFNDKIEFDYNKFTKKIANALK